MKKIVGILAAAAIATSVFAADVSASTKIDGSLFSYSADKTFALFTEFNGSHVYANPNITFSVSDDKAGAKIELTTDTDKGMWQADGYQDVARGKTTVGLEYQQIWFKPVDALKITVGDYDVALNKETIKWTESVYGASSGQDRAGYLLSVNVDAFSLDFGMHAWNGAWFTKTDGVDGEAAREFFLKAGYSADFGSIGVWAEFNGRKNELTEGYVGRKTFQFHDHFWGLQPKTEGFVRDIAFAASYRNNFDGLDLFVNVGGYMDDKFEWVRPEVYVGGNVDAFGYKAFVAPIFFLDSNVKDQLEAADEKAFQCEVLVRVQYALDATTVYARFEDHDIIAKKFVSELRFGAEGNLGCMSYDAWLQVNTGEGADKDKVAISLPFQLKVNF